MTTIIWNAKAGKVISLLYDSGKDKKILNLGHPVEIGDKKIMDEIDNAIGVIDRHVISISDCNGNNCDKGTNSKFLNVNNTNIKERTIDSLKYDVIGEVLIRFIQEPDKKYQGWIGTTTELYEQLCARLGDLDIGYGRKQFPRSRMALAKRIDVIIASLKAAGVVVERFRDRRDKTINDGKVERLVKITYVGSEELISKEDSGIKKDTDIKMVVDTANKKGSEDPRNAMLIPKNKVIKTRNRQGSKMYNEYDIAFQHVIPELLDGIKKSNDGVVVKISDMVKELGESFAKKSDVSIYMGIRHILFKHKIRVVQCTFEEIDPVTNKGRKGLKMTVLKDSDPLPCSIKRLKEYR